MYGCNRADNSKTANTTGPPVLVVAYTGTTTGECCSCTRRPRTPASLRYAPMHSHTHTHTHTYAPKHTHTRTYAQIQPTRPHIQQCARQMSASAMLWWTLAPDCLSCQIWHTKQVLRHLARVVFAQRHKLRQRASLHIQYSLCMLYLDNILTVYNHAFFCTAQHHSCGIKVNCPSECVIHKFT